jgi:hypothetical protein
MLLLVATPVAPFPGTTVVTVGCVVLATPDVPVVNVLVNGTTVFPAWSVNPLAVTVYVVLTASKLLAVNVSVVRSLLTLIVPVTGTPPADTVTALLPTLAKLTGALTTTTACAFTGTLLAPFGGLTCTTVGALVAAPNPVLKLVNRNCKP